MGTIRNGTESARCLRKAVLQANGQLRQSSEGPRDDNIAALALAIVLIKHKLVDFDDFIFVYSDWGAVWSFGLAVDEHLTELSDEPAAKLDHAHLVDVLLHGEVDFRDAVLVQLRRRGNNSDQLRDVLFSYMMIR